MRGLSRAWIALLLAVPIPALAAPDRPEPVPGDFVIRDFRFASGEKLGELKIHYLTLGQPLRDASGVVRNAVLILHGTTGSGRQFLSPNFAGVLFGPGQLLDSSKYFLILPDGIGAAQHRRLVEGLKVNHLRLVIGTSMGGMHSWVWAETFPDFADGFVPLASVPTQIAGRNRVMRK